MNTDQFKERVWSNASCTDIIDHLKQKGAVTDKTMRDYMIRDEFETRWKTTKETHRQILSDLAAKYDLSYSAVVYIVK